MNENYSYVISDKKMGVNLCHKEKNMSEINLMQGILGIINSDLDLAYEEFIQEL